MLSIMQIREVMASGLFGSLYKGRVKWSQTGMERDMQNDNVNGYQGGLEEPNLSLSSSAEQTSSPTLRGSMPNYVQTSVHV